MTAAVRQVASYGQYRNKRSLSARKHISVQANDPERPFGVGV